MNKTGISSGIQTGLGNSTGDKHSGDHIKSHISGTPGLGDNSDISGKSDALAIESGTAGDITADKK